MIFIDFYTVFDFVDDFVENVVILYDTQQALNTVTIPNSVTSIEWDAFYFVPIENLTMDMTLIPHFTFERTSLKNLTLGNNVTSIGEYAFSNCINLTTAAIPNSVTSIGVGAFMVCINLTSVTIPNSVTSIADYAFNSCEKLTFVTIGNSVTSIGDNAFWGCVNLTSMRFESSKPPVLGLGSLYTPGLFTIYVPWGSKAAYRAEPQLSGVNIVEFGMPCENCGVCAECVPTTTPVSTTSTEFVTTAPTMTVITTDSVTSVNVITTREIITTPSNITTEAVTTITTPPNTTTEVVTTATTLPNPTTESVTTVTTHPNTTAEMATTTTKQSNSITEIITTTTTAPTTITITTSTTFLPICAVCGTSNCQIDHIAQPYRIVCNCDCGVSSTVGKVGHVLGNERISVVDALEILKYIVGFNNAIEICDNARNAATIVSVSVTIADALEILKKLVSIPNLIDNPNMIDEYEVQLIARYGRGEWETNDSPFRSSAVKIKSGANSGSYSATIDTDLGAVGQPDLVSLHLSSIGANFNNTLTNWGSIPFVPMSLEGATVRVTSVVINDVVDTLKSPFEVPLIAKQCADGKNMAAGRVDIPIWCGWLPSTFERFDPVRIRSVQHGAVSDGISFGLMSGRIWKIEVEFLIF